MTSTRDTQCTLCNKLFRGPQGLGSHVSQKHPDEESVVSNANPAISKIKKKKNNQSQYLQGRVFTRGPSKALLKEMKKLPKGKYSPDVSTLTSDELSMVDSLRRTEYVTRDFWVTFVQGGAAGTK